MNSKQIVYLSAMIGATVGSFIPALWGADAFSLSSILFSIVLGFFGIWIGYRIAY